MSILIHCGQLIDGLGGTHADTAVVVEDGRIVSTQAWRADLASAGSHDRVLDYSAATVMPGLIEAHGHMGLIGDALQLSAAEIAAHIFGNVTTALDEGFTTVRDAGGIDGGVAACVTTGLIKGPRILPSGPFMSQTGGHGDTWNKWHGGGNPSVPGLVRTAIVADGPDAVRKAARDVFRRGATQIKVCVSGGVSSGGNLDVCEFTVAELAALVEEAQTKKTYVHAHAHTAASIRHGLAAGIRHFEHGSMLDEETAALMREQGAFLVPTLLVLKRLIAVETSPARRSMLEDLAASVNVSVRRAVSADVPVGSGSDLLGTDQRGRAEEIVLKADLIGPMAAIVSATSTNARIIGLEGHVGSVVPGARADLLVIDGDPVEDPAVLMDRSRILAVLRDGAVVAGLQHETAA
ncbi:amidohydrolase family protein [Nonomuraea sp. NPDC048826]|uniref:metal-dependent hydrolase family protein n=1 Tax=Nonomuraea sp. NPDC048826 TaxID=3364347 RepID=UPI0037143FB1